MTPEEQDAKYPWIDCPLCSRKMRSGRGGMWLHYIEFGCDYVEALQYAKGFLTVLANPSVWRVIEKRRPKLGPEHAAMALRELQGGPQAGEVQTETIYEGTIRFVNPAKAPWIMAADTANIAHQRACQCDRCKPDFNFTKVEGYQT